MFLGTSAFCLTNHGPLSTSALVEGSVTRFGGPEAAQADVDAPEWLQSRAFTAHPERALVLTAEVGGSPYPPLRGKYVDFDNTMCITGELYARRPGKALDTKARAPKVFPGDRVTLDCTRGYQGLLAAHWACERVCD